MSNFVGRFSANNTMTKIVKYGANIIFIGAIIILSYLSFVENFAINPDVRSITTLALVSALLNYIVWDMRYKSDYNKVLLNDINNVEYSVHKRYYLARKGWKYDALQIAIRTYNANFIESWIQDVEDITGRTREQIVKGKYIKNPHKILIWRLKHRMYPKSGVKTPKDMLYMLSVGKGDRLKINVRRAEHYHIRKKCTKAITSILATVLVASLVYDFIQGDIKGAILKLILNVGVLCINWILGSFMGIKGAQIKLDDTEEVCEKLEEWKNEEPTEVPFKEPQAIPVVSSEKPPEKPPEKPAEEHKGITIECT